MCLYFIQKQKRAGDKSRNGANEKANGDLRPVSVVRIFFWAREI
jgi:hypothetical protein